MTDNKESQTPPVGRYQPGMPWNPVEKVIFERRSVRAFKKDPLPDSLIKRVLEAGRFAPSAGNVQPWKYVVINDPQIIEQMERDTVKHTRFLMFFLDYTRSLLRRIFLAPLIKLGIRIVPNQLHHVPFTLMQQIAAGKAPVYHGAPAMIIVMTDKRGVGTPSLETGICGQNMVLTAHSLGLGTCWVGMIKILIKMRKWRRFLRIKYPYKVTDCIMLGYPKMRFDGQVEREVQLVDWHDPSTGGKPKTERLGD